MNPVWLKPSLRTALTLLAFAALGTALLAFTFAQTRPIIARSEEAARLALVSQVLPAGSFDNNAVADAIELPADPLLGTREASRAYPARRGGEPTGVVLETVAPDGYSGRIDLLVGITAEGRVAGVRVVAHKETPGLGDYIEVARSDWIHGFDGRALGDPPAQGWAVRKDGGAFDYMAGATVTPRAVIKSVRRALEYFGQHRGQLLAPQRGRS